MGKGTQYYVPRSGSEGMPASHGDALEREFRLREGSAARTADGSRACGHAALGSLDERPALRHPHRDRFPMSPHGSSRSRSRRRPAGTSPRSRRRSRARRAGRCGSPSPRTARCCSRSGARRGCLLLRLHRMFLHAPDAVVASLARNIRRRGRAADGEVRRFMNENLHRVRKTPRELPPLVTSGPRPRPRRGLRGHQRPLLRRPPAGPDHLGPRRRPRAAGRAHLRQLRPRARPHPHPPRARPARRARATSSRASSTTRCSTTTWAACPTARGAPSTTRGPSARPRRASPATARPWPGRRRTSRTCCGRASALDRERRAARAAARAAGR